MYNGSVLPVVPDAPDGSRTTGGGFEGLNTQVCAHIILPQENKKHNFT
jgi:hypothetical protein